jgi:hypothetical protein
MRIHMDSLILVPISAHSTTNQDISERITRDTKRGEGKITMHLNPKKSVDEILQKTLSKMCIKNHGT